MNHARLTPALLLFATAAAAQNAPTRRTSQYVADRWNTESGLPQVSVNDILQTRDGYLWLATYGGVARFDGVAFTSITTGDLTGLRSDRINALAQDKSGRIWMATDAGLSRYEAGRITTIDTRPGMAAEAVNTVAATPGGAVWFGTEHGGLGRVDSVGVHVVVAPGSRFGIVNTQIVADARGRVWVNSATGVWRFDGAAAAPTLMMPAREFVSWKRSITADTVGRVWVMVDSGLMRFDDDGSHLFPVPGLAADEMRAIASRGDNVVWIGTAKGAAWRFAPDSGIAIPIPTDDESATASIALDREGGVWIGSRISGLSRLRRSLFQSYAKPDGLAHDNLSSVFSDSRGRVWVAARCVPVSVIQGGMARTLPANQAPNCTLTFAEDTSGAIWMGGSGVVRWRDGRAQRMDSVAGWPERGVRALFRDRSGTLWIGGVGRVLSWDGRRVHEIVTDSLTRPGEVQTLVQTHDGAILVGGLRGLFRVSGDRLERVDALAVPAGVAVRAIYEDSTGALWIGTYGAGLARLDNGRTRWFTTAEGLFDNYLSSITGDNAGNLWLSSNRGVFRIADRELEDAASGAADRVHSVAYGRADGMLSSETNGGFQPAMSRTADGLFWYPTLRGVAVFDPARAVSAVAPVLTLDRTTVNGRPQPPGVKTFGPGAVDLELTYTGVSLASPAAVAFRYRLDSWDKDWIDAGTRRSAIYSRLAPGKYTFHVQAANRDRVWSPQTASIEFAVLPYFWQTWWFRGAALFAIAMVPVARDRTQRQRQRELTRLVDNKTSELRQQKTEIEQQARALERQNEILAENVRLKDDVERISRHDLRTPLNSIISLAQIVREDQALAAEHVASLKLIEQAGYRVMNMANLTLDLYKMEQGVYRLTPRPINIQLVAERVLQDLRPLIRTHEITVDLRFESFEGLPSVQGDELLCYSLLSNLVKNAVEAAPAESVVTVRMTGGERVRIAIHNRGAIPVSLRARLFEKYATADKKGGVGLGAYSARLMAETQGGSVRADTSDPDATTIVVELPPGAGEIVDARTGEWRRPSVPLNIRDTQSRSILVVDDDGSNRAVLRLYLSHPTWHVDEAENGPLAVRMFAGHDYDLVILDIDMPVMDGFQVAAAIRGQESERPAGHRRARLVALSSHDDEATKQRALAAGCDQYLTKPASRATIVALLAPEVAATVGDADVAALLPAFLRAKRAEVADLATAFERGDAEEVRRLSHRLRGGFSVYGFASAAAICAEIEHFATPVTLANVGAKLPLLYEEMNRLPSADGSPPAGETNA